MSSSQHLASFVLLFALGCVEAQGAADDDASVPASTDASTDAADPTLCESQDQLQVAFDAWASARPTPQGAYSAQYILEAIVEPGPQPAFAVRQRMSFWPGTSDDSSFVVWLSPQGEELGRAMGRYIDRLDPTTVLVDKAYVQLHYGASNDPLYYKGLQIEAVGRDGVTQWRIPSRGNAKLSKVFRMDGDHFMIMGLTHSNIEPDLIYFDSAGTLSAPPTGDQRACAKQQHSWCATGC